MQKIIPAKLQPGDLVKVVAPSRSIALISQETREIADQRFAELGLRLAFAEHVEECDDFASSSIESRVADLHEAFANPKVKAILTVLGGFNSHQLLRYLDWDLIKANPKIFCGYSDITALSNAIYAKSGLVSYSGPHYSSFGQKLYFDYTLEYFKRCLCSEEPLVITSSSEWSDDSWYLHQDQRELLSNDGWLVVHEGEAEGTIIGANIGTFNLLQGTEYSPSLENTILFIEDDAETLPHTFDRDLQSVIHRPDFSGIRGIVIGRFQKASKMSTEKLLAIIQTKQELTDLPIIANLDFGHTDPKITFPIGGEAKLRVAKNDSQVKVTVH